MVTRDEFIEREILPTLGEHVGDFDVDGICDRVSDFDPNKGYVWKPEYLDRLDPAVYNSVLSEFDVAGDGRRNLATAAMLSIPVNSDLDDPGKIRAALGIGTPDGGAIYNPLAYKALYHGATLTEGSIEHGVWFVDITPDMILLGDDGPMLAPGVLTDDDCAVDADELDSLLESVSREPGWGELTASRIEASRFVGYPDPALPCVWVSDSDSVWWIARVEVWVGEKWGVAAYPGWEHSRTSDAFSVGFTGTVDVYDSREDALLGAAALLAAIAGDEPSVRRAISVARGVYKARVADVCGLELDMASSSVEGMGLVRIPVLSSSVPEPLKLRAAKAYDRKVRPDAEMEFTVYAGWDGSIDLRASFPATHDTDAEDERIEVGIELSSAEVQELSAKFWDISHDAAAPEQHVPEKGVRSRRR